MTLPRTVLGLFAGPALALAACGPGAAAGAVRPDAKTAAEALDERGCGADDVSPLVVDLPTSQRVELEAALRKGGVILAAHDCKSVRLLFECSVSAFGVREPRYAYAATTLKEDVVRMKDADSLHANVPVLAAKLEGSVQRGSVLDLAVAVAGTHTAIANRGADTLPAPLNRAYKGDLSPACQTATHYVRSIQVGAFALNVGSQANVRAAAEVFKAGGGTESESARSHEARDGSLDACRAGSPDAKSPTPGCGVPLRLGMRKLDPRTSVQAHCEEDTDRIAVEACQQWAGDLARNVRSGEKTPDRSRAAQRLVALCDVGWLEACRSAKVVLSDQGAPDLEVSRKIMERACNLGDPPSCEERAEALLAAGDPPRALGALEMGCRHLGVKSCTKAADLVEAGAGPEAEWRASGGRRQATLDLRARSCTYPNDACAKYAAAYRAGARARGDFTPFAKMIETCEAKREGCVAATAASVFGLGVTRDLARAKQLWKRHCEAAHGVCSYPNCDVGCAFPKEWE